MPSSTEILANLTAIANGNGVVAFAWHIAIAIALLRLLGTWRPTPRQALIGLGALPASVSVLALSGGSPFNGTVFALLTMVALVCAIRFDRQVTCAGSPAALASGAGMLMFGLLYPHFVTGSTPFIYLVAAPTGVIPCPTLAVLIGFTLLSPGFLPKLWSGALVALGVFFSLFGVLRLKVWLDGGLLVGTACLWLLTFGTGRRPARGRLVRLGQQT